MNEQTTATRIPGTLAALTGQDQGFQDKEQGLRFLVNASYVGGDGQHNVVAQFASPQLAAALLPIIAVQSGCLFAELYDAEKEQPISKAFRDETGQTFIIPAEARFLVREMGEGKQTWDVVAAHVDEPTAIKWFEGEAMDLGRKTGGDVQLVSLEELTVVRSTVSEQVGTDLWKAGDYALHQPEPVNKMPA